MFYKFSKEIYQKKLMRALGLAMSSGCNISMCLLATIGVEKFPTKIAINWVFQVERVPPKKKKNNTEKSIPPLKKNTRTPTCAVRPCKMRRFSKEIL